MHGVSESIVSMRGICDFIILFMHIGILMFVFPFRLMAA